MSGPRLRHAVPLALVLGAIAPSAAGAHAFSPLDEHWLQSSIQGDRFEIAGAKLALGRSSNAAVRKLAARLRKDHTKSLKEAVAEARRLGISVPKNPTPPQAWEIAAVATFGGRAFDRQYSSLEVGDHLQDITESKEERAKGANTAIRKLAAQDLPELRAHLRLSRAAFRAS
jgi:putative membrane protein